MTDMIEIVARALAGVGYGEREHHPWDCLKRDDPEDAAFVLEQARAAIEAMREPTEAMVEAFEYANTTPEKMMPEIHSSERSAP